MLIVIPFCSENAAQAETLIDWIYQLAGREAYGNALLVASNEVHPEIREKIKVSAELAFASSEMIQLEKFSGVKNECINHAFRLTADYIGRNYKEAFFWMEPDTTPIKVGWHKQLEAAYDLQPRRYSGSFLRAGEKQFTARSLCYPANALADLAAFCTGSLATFNVQAEKNLTVRATMQRLVAEFPIKEPEDCAKIIPTAILVHGDKSQILLRQLKAEQK